jgi:hypothetical protein
MDVRAQRTIYNDSIDILLVDRFENGCYTVAEPLMMKVMEPGQAITGPTFKLTPTEAQRLMDELWVCGLRPSEGSGSAGALAATERHLKDMQKLVFKEPRIRNTVEPKPLT